MAEVGPSPCPNCGQHTDAHERACPRCGLPRDLPVFDDYGTFLGTTFAPVRQARPAQPPSAAPQVPPHAAQPGGIPPGSPHAFTQTGHTIAMPPQRGRRVLLIVLGAVVVILLGITAGLLFTDRSKTPDTVVPPAPSPDETSVVSSPSPMTQPPRPTPTPSPTPTVTAAPSPRPTPSPTPIAPTPSPSRTSGPVGATETYANPNGGSCLVPSEWEPRDIEGGRSWRRGDAGVTCETVAVDLAAIKSMVEDGWDGDYDVTFSSGDAQQYRASGFTPEGHIFWLGAKHRSGAATSTLTYWEYPTADKGEFDDYIERAWTALTPG